tara:strand:+ start:171 stop:620 length:450 start_codon:yes stop_codon:yes gene_type:complete
MKKILILLLLFTSCGYQPIYKVDQKNNNFKIGGVKLSGNNNLSKKIFLNLPITINKNDKSLNELKLDTTKNILETSKNSKGQVDSYKTSIKVKLILLDNNNQILKEKFFTKDFSYNIKDNKFKFKEYQIEIENNLVNEIVRDILIYLNV